MGERHRIVCIWVRLACGEAFENIFQLVYLPIQKYPVILDSNSEVTASL